uniref:GRF-type domain-containing protein n=1 Tax=Chenopodium quinoa TaxID=63459 RepID=A0A803N2Y7_CHEQI
MERGKHQQRSGSSSSTNSGFVASIRCNCGREAVVRTVKKGPNLGKKFHSCPLWPDTDCKLFKWAEGGDAIADELRFQLFEKDTTIAELELEKSLIEEKVNKLEVTKSKLQEETKKLTAEVTQLRIELMKSARMEKNVSMAFESNVFDRQKHVSESSISAYRLDLIESQTHGCLTDPVG